MYGKQFVEINTKELIRFKKKKSYSVGRLFYEKEYSLFKLVIHNNDNIIVNEKDFLLITEISNEKFYSKYIKKKIILNRKTSKSYYFCFQKKKNKMSFLGLKKKKKKKIFKIKKQNKKKNKKKK